VQCFIIKNIYLSEIKRVESGDKHKHVSTLELHHDRPSSNSIKVRIPAKDFPKVISSGPPLRKKLEVFRFWKSQAIFLEVPIFRALIKNELIRIPGPILDHITK